MTFGEAIEALKVGDRVSRAGWENNKASLELVRLEGEPPFIRSVYNQGTEASPWPAPHEDMLAEDWFVPEFAAAHADDAGAISRP